MTVRSTFLSLLLIFGLGLSGCGSDSDGVANTATSDRTSENSNSTRSNVEELGMLVNVRYETEDIVWKQDVDKQRVIAVMRFSPADADKIVSTARTHGDVAGVSIAPETWFPVELIAQSDARGDNTLRGTAMPANDFFLKPYTAGRITRIEGTEYFVLEITVQ